MVALPFWSMWLESTVVFQAERREPAQGAQPGHETILATPRYDKLRQAFQPAAQRSLRDVESAGPVSGPGDGILHAAAAEKLCVLQPLLLNELKLPPQVRPDKSEHQSAILAVVLQSAIGQRRSVSGSARVHPANMRARWRLVADRIILLVKKIVVALSISTLRGIILQGTKGQRRTATPAPQHLSCA